MTDLRKRMHVCIDSLTESQLMPLWPLMEYLTAATNTWTEEEREAISDALAKIQS